MAQVTIETVAYPSWWSDATTVLILLRSDAGGTAYTFDRVDIEFLPEGVAHNSGYLFPWNSITRLHKES